MFEFIAVGLLVLIPSAYTAKFHPEQNNGKRYFDPYGWSNTTVNAILDRQEYLGHTILKKSVSTNFKTDKRRSTSEDEQYIFYFTHEAIVSQELWDSVQKQRVRSPRKTPAGTYQQHKLSGYLFCSDCGSRMALQSAKKHKDGDPDDRYYSFRCGAYGQRGTECSAHYVNAEAVEGLILSSIQRLSKFVIEDEAAFAEQLRLKAQAKVDAVPVEKKQQLEELERQYEELDVKLRSLYENFFAGLILERLNKMFGTKAIYRTPGSIDIVGAVRSALLIGRSKENDDERVMVQQKSNLAPTGAAIVFSVGEDGISFIKESELTADELLACSSDKTGRPDTKTQEAMEIIRDLLSDGEEHEASECEARLNEAGISKSTAKKAKRILGVVSNKPHYSWYWRLPIDED